MIQNFFVTMQSERGGIHDERIKDDFRQVDAGKNATRVGEASALSLQGGAA